MQPTAYFELNFAPNVQLVSNPNMHWQKRSLHSLGCVAVELISVTEQ